MKDIIVEFAGWVRISPQNVRFQHSSTDNIITGVEWLALSESNREDYILECVIATQRDAQDKEYVQIDVFEDDSP